MKAPLVLAGVVLAIAAIALGVVAATNSGASSDLSNQSMPDWLYKSAISKASQCGDPTPSAMTWTLTTAGVATQVFEGKPVADSSVANKSMYVVVLRGNFVYEAASIPPGAQLPKGDTIVIWADPASQQLTDFGVVAGVDVKDLGTMTAVDITQVQADVKAAIESRATTP